MASLRHVKYPRHEEPYRALVPHSFQQLYGELYKVGSGPTPKPCRRQDILSSYFLRFCGLRNILSHSLSRR